MRDTLDRLIIYLAITLMLLCIISFIIVFLLTNGVRINRKLEKSTEGLNLIEYEQVYHVFMGQEIFLSISNDANQMIGTLTIREKTSGKTETLHKIRPGKKTKLYFNLDSYFKDVEFEVIELIFVEMY